MKKKAAEAGEAFPLLALKCRRIHGLKPNLVDLLVHHVPVVVIRERWGLSPACLYAWQQAFLLHGLDSLVYHHGGGRQPKLTPRQKKRLVELIEAGPQVVGCETACWTSVLLRVLIWREFGVLYNLGFSFQKARFVS